MNGIEGFFENKLGNLKEALSRTTERHAKLSQNLANLNTPGYKRQDLDFNVALTQAEKRMQAAKEQAEQRASDQTSIRADGNNVDLEREVAGVAETEMRFAALTQMTADYFQGLKSAIREGR